MPRRLRNNTGRGCHPHFKLTGDNPELVEGPIDEFADENLINDGSDGPPDPDPLGDNVETPYPAEGGTSAETEHGPADQ